MDDAEKAAFSDLIADLDGMARFFANALEVTAQTVQDGVEQHAVVGAKSSAKGIHGYNAFREKIAKSELDDLSRKLGDKFPLSAKFDEAMKNDNTPLNVETIQKENVKQLPGESKYATGKKAFKNAYGGNTDVHIKQLGIDVRLNTDVVGETLAKAYDETDVQSHLDLIPKIKSILEKGVLMQVERVGHLNNKKESLFGYRLYGTYDYVDANGNVTPKAVVCTVVQNLNDAYTHVFRDIENVTLKHGLTGAKDSAGISEEFESDKYTIAQLYDDVKKIARKDGGLKYSDSERNELLFAYSETEDGDKYSSKADNDMYKRLVEEHGAIKPGEKPSRDVSKNNKLYLTVTLNEKEAGISPQPTDDNNRPLVYGPPASEISIADLIAGVKDDSGYFFKYLPDSMLNEARIESKRTAVVEEEARLAKMREEFAAEKAEQQKERQEKETARIAVPTVNTGNTTVDRVVTEL